jgi:hypothetical protein
MLLIYKDKAKLQYKEIIIINTYNERRYSESN